MHLPKHQLAMTVGLQAVIGDSLGADELAGGGSLFCFLLCFFTHLAYTSIRRIAAWS